MMNATGSGMVDVAVVGLGPAGRALASRCAAAGLRVLAVDPEPDAPWRQTLSLWSEQLPPWLPRDVLAHTVHGPTLHSAGRAVIDMEYAVLDNRRLREVLPLGPGVTVEQARLDDEGVRALTGRAHRVVDCRGVRPGPGTPLQTAYGIVVSAADAARALGGDPALFMDWRTDHDDDGLGPTFLYGLPLGADRVLLEETCLAGLPAPDPADLAGRLRSRLRRRGVAERAVEEPLAVELVRIPLLPPPPPTGQLVGAFGTAGGYGHAATGYSVASMLEAVPAVVHALATGHPLPEPRSAAATGLHRLGLDAMLHADDGTLRQLFGAFGRLDSRRQLWFLDGSSPSYQVAGAMWRMWLGMPARAKVGLVRAVGR
jgi:lycopene beta-cyclase